MQLPNFLKPGTVNRWQTRRIAWRKSRQCFEQGWTAPGPPAAWAMDASTTSCFDCLLLADTITLENGFCRVEILALRVEKDVVEVFRPLSECAGLVQVGARDLGLADFV